MRQRRCTTTLTLVLISTAALHSCGKEEESTPATRDIYRTRADCQRDWDDAAKCESVASGPHAGMFYGPLLYGLASGMGSRGPMGSAMAPRHGTNAIASTSVPRSGGTSRGGFGSSASSYSSGG